MRIPQAAATRFILMHTKQNENVGATARAMKTMGFFDLALVSPHDPKVLHRNKTIQRASGATDILKSAKIYSTLDEALMDNHGNEIICGTGMPFDMYQERPERKYAEPRTFFAQLVNDGDDNVSITSVDNNDRGDNVIRIAFIFGNERSGMHESEMDKCQYMLGIPTNPKFGSLNLASAVQLIAYDWRVALGSYYDAQ
jgi:tRNA/rRNA methyltransferase